MFHKELEKCHPIMQKDFKKTILQCVTLLIKFMKILILKKKKRIRNIFINKIIFRINI